MARVIFLYSEPSGSNEFGLDILSDQELVKRFNDQIVPQAIWVGARGRFLSEFRNEVIKRQWRYPSSWMDSSTLNLRHKILLVENEVNIDVKP